MLGPCSICGRNAPYGTVDGDRFCRKCVDRLAILLKNGAPLWKVVPVIVESHPQVSAEGDLAIVYLEMGEYAEALGSARRALELTSTPIVNLGLRVIFDERVLPNKIALMKVVRGQYVGL